jgi:hypothetical protein
MAKQSEQMLWVGIAAVAIAAAYFLMRKPSVSIQTLQSARQPVLDLSPQVSPVSSIISRLATSGDTSSIAPVSIAVKAPAIDIMQSPDISNYFGETPQQLL